MQLYNLETHHVICPVNTYHKWSKYKIEIVRWMDGTVVEIR